VPRDRCEPLCLLGRLAPDPGGGGHPGDLRGRRAFPGAHGRGSARGLRLRAGRPGHGARPGVRSVPGRRRDRRVGLRPVQPLPCCRRPGGSAAFPRSAASSRAPFRRRTRFRRCGSWWSRPWSACT
jgi:hypothetical protein